MQSGQERSARGGGKKGGQAGAGSAEAAVCLDAVKGEECCGSTPTPIPPFLGTLSSVVVLQVGGGGGGLHFYNSKSSFVGLSDKRHPGGVRLRHECGPRGHQQKLHAERALLAQA